VAITEERSNSKRPKTGFINYLTAYAPFAVQKNNPTGLL
jgi:hypothetical protein